MKSSTVVALGAVAAAAAGLAYVAVTQGQAPSPCTPPPGMFTIQVVDAATTKPIQAASVTYGSEKKSVNSSGCVSFSPVSGFTPLVASALGYQSVTQPNFQGTSGQIYQVPLTNLAPGTASATVVVKSAATLQPIAGAKVSIDGQSGTTDTTGSVAFQGLTIGSTYTITASATGYLSNSQPYALTMDGELLSITLVGGVPYGESLTGYQFALPGPPFSSASAFWQNLSSAPITASMWVTIKNSIGQPVSLGQSPLVTIQPANPNPPPYTDQQLTAPLSPQLAPGTYTATFFCVDDSNRPVSKSFTFTVTVP